jgi:hypothetical protein
VAEPGVTAPVVVGAVAVGAAVQLLAANTARSQGAIRDRLNIDGPFFQASNGVKTLSDRNGSGQRPCWQTDSG